MVLVYPPQLASTDRRAAPPENDYGTAYRAIVRAARGAKIVGLKRTAALTTADEGDTWLDPAAARLGAAATAVLLLVAADVDALAAARVLARLLTDDDVPYRIVPVEGYASLAQIIKQHVVSNDLLRSVVFLNLGSLLSLSTYFRTAQSGQDPDSDANSALSDDEDELTRLPLPPLCTVHVIDSHRPWNLDSLYATSDIMDRICIWDDGGAADLTDVAEAYDMLEFDDGLDTEDESDNEDDDDRSDRSDEDVNVDEDEGEVRPRKKSRLGTDGLPLSPGHPTKPKRLTDHARAVYQNVLTRYYERGTTMGRSVAAMLWMMAEGLGRVDNEILWLGILGVTSQYTSGQIGSAFYGEQADELAEGVIARNPDPDRGGGGDVAQLAHDEEDDGDDGASAVTRATTKSKGGAKSLLDASRTLGADSQAIRVVNAELRFVLYRHWSLEESMLHTGFVASKLSLWRDAGRAQLRGLLAKMGFSLTACRQPHAYMDLDLRKALVPRIKTIAREYGLGDSTFRSFARQRGFRAPELSAADAVEGAAALLHAATGVNVTVDAPGLAFSAPPAAQGWRAASAAAAGGTYTSDWFASKRAWRLPGSGVLPSGPPGSSSNGAASAAADAELDAGEEATQVEERRKDAWVRNFFAAYSALDATRPQSLDLLQSSLVLAQALHRAVLSTGITLVEKHAIKALRNFRVVVLKDGPDLALFAQPAMLARLAHWLVEALRDSIADMERRQAHQKAAAAAAAAQRRSRKRPRTQPATTSSSSDPTGDDERSQDAEAALEAREHAERLAARRGLAFVVAVLDVPRNTYVVMGLAGGSQVGAVKANKFGLAFQSAALDEDMELVHDRFDTHFVDVPKDRLTHFLEALHRRV